MGMTIECGKCNFIDRYDSSEAYNIGTHINPIFAVKCKFCGAEIVEASKSSEPIVIPFKSKENVKNELIDRLEGKTLPERILEKYFIENYINYGFDRISGPFNKGNDFNVTIKGKEFKLELETDIFNYIIHGHHESKAFKNVEYLIYLTENNKIIPYRNKIPKNLVRIDEEHFIEWCLKKSEPELLVSNLGFRYKLIFNEYVKLFHEEICDRKNSDMAICPDCIDCAYFPEEIIKEYTNTYVINHLEILTDESYDFSMITKDNLREIF